MSCHLRLPEPWLGLFSLNLASVYLYETHLSVANTAASQDFYTRVVGLKFAHRDLTRDIIFLWAGDDRRSMLGLWGPDYHLRS
jgi:lactoylglutathione lyase